MLYNITALVMLGRASSHSCSCASSE